MALINPKELRLRPNLLLTTIIVTTALYFGREVFVPIATAILLSFLAAPLVEALERRGFGRVSAVLCTVGLGALVVGGFSFVLARQVYDLAYKLPEYTDNIVARVEFFQGESDGVVSRVTKTIDAVHERLSNGQHERSNRADVTTESGAQPSESNAAATPGLALVENGNAKKPVPVEITQSLSMSDSAVKLVGGLIGPLGTVSSIVVLVIFMLLKREDLRNRFISLVGGKRLHITTQAIDDAAQRISRYLLMQLLVNAIYGLFIFIGLALIGLPNALLWGVMAAILRFVPFIGPFVAAAVPVVISLAAFDGWMQPCLVLALYIANEVVSGMVIEPWLFGSSTGLSAIGMLVATAFWTWLWGPVGMILATPLTVCLSVMGRYVPQLEPLNTLLGEEDALPPHARYYQRLLANDPEEAVEVTEEYLASHPLESLYDRVLVPALNLAERDWRIGGLDDAKRELILHTTREIVEELGERERQIDAEGRRLNVFAPAGEVLCLPAHSEADEITGLMLKQLLERKDIRTEVASHHALRGELIDQIQRDSVGVVCVTSLQPARTTYARYICKRLQGRIPGLTLAVGLWQSQPVVKRVSDRFTATGCNSIFVSLEVAARELEVIAKAFAQSQRADADTIVEYRRSA